MIESIVPMIIMTGMFAMIFGIVYIRSRENMAMIEKGLNPRQAKATPRPFISLKYGLLLMGCGLGLLSAYIIDHNLIDHSKTTAQSGITIGGHHNHHRNNNIATPADTSHTAKDTCIAAHSTMPGNNPSSDNDEEHSIIETHNSGPESVPIYFALIAIGGGLGLFFSYRIEKKEWLDKVKSE